MAGKSSIVLLAVIVVALACAVSAATGPCHALKAADGSKTKKFNLDALSNLSPIEIQAPDPHNPFNTYTFEFTVCKSEVSCGNSKAAGCQEWTGGQASLGTYGSPVTANVIPKSSEYPKGGVVLFASGGEGGRKMEVYIKCTSDKIPTNVEAIAPMEVSSPYIFRLSHKAGCPAGGLSPGSICLIVLVVVAFVYFVGGFIFLKFVQKKEGVEAIPQGEFWTGLPGLCKDGVMFIVNKVRGSPSNYETVA